jgi:hypothetical protein
MIHTVISYMKQLIVLTLLTFALASAQGTLRSKDQFSINAYLWDDSPGYRKYILDLASCKTISLKGTFTVFHDAGRTEVVFDNSTQATCTVFK